MKEINFKVNLSYGGASLSDSDKNALHYMFIFWGIIVPIIVFFGLIGNSLTMSVLFRREMRSPTILYLRALVLSDTIILITSILSLSLYGLSQSVKGLHYFEDFTYPLIFIPIEFISLSTQTFNVWITVSVSVERYISICHPFRAARFVNKKYTLIVIAAIVVMSIVYNIPRLFEKVTVPCKDKKCYVLLTTNIGNTAIYTVYRTYLYIAVMFVIPLAALVIINCLIIIELMSMRRRQRNTNIQGDDESNLSVALIMIVVVFITCQSLALLAQFDNILSVREFIKFLTISNTMVVLNSAVNFPIYVGVGRKFRTVLRKKVLSICFRNRHRGSSSTANGVSRRTTATDIDRGDTNVNNSLLKRPSEATRL